MSWYLTIRADATYSQAVPTQQVADFLLRYPDVKQTSPVDFIFRDASIILALCNAIGNYATYKQFIPEVNVVELVVPYAMPQAPYEALGVALAIHLGWEVFEDHEDRKIWPLH